MNCKNGEILITTQYFKFAKNSQRNGLPVKSIWLIALLLMSSVTPAFADSPGCTTTNHCYSVINSSGTTFYGVYGTWNRADMNASNDTSHTRFITSEMWAANSSRTAWVETGLVAGYLNPQGASAPHFTGYRAFYARLTTSGSYAEYNFGTVVQDDTITDEFQISRSSTMNEWMVYFDGNLKVTTDVGFWSTSEIDAGGEVATAYGTSNIFTMFLKGINSSGQRVNLGTQSSYVEDPPLYGNSPSNSTWKWRIRP
jgi:hypothetical protein